MTATAAYSQLGKGIYSVPDIAFLLGLPKPKVRRWLNDFWDERLAEKGGQKYSWGEGRDKATDFYTLVEFYVFYQLREKGVQARAIFSAYYEMAKHLHTKHPFASAQVLTDGKSILYTLEDGTTIATDKTRQVALREIIEAFCQKIEFADNQLAEKYYPLGKTVPVVVSPHHQFGQPVIEHTNILAETIYDMHSSGESNAFLARLYDISTEQVKAAITLFTKQAA